ncbi:MAG TPA: hypothetical protein DCW68_06095 [Rhodospirillaceae bacterium]|nr:MAG: hypothetical protein A2018_03660 [Alphaproteobacteria bacterium GWF2_58_20]HAU29662.1 hypothetical protein [Rhodospirillaceae bacterium]
MAKKHLMPPEPSPDAPAYCSGLWIGEVREINNCYAYAVNDRRPYRRIYFPQPGGKSGLSDQQHKLRNVQQLIWCAERDGLIRAFLPVAKPGCYLVALAVTKESSMSGAPCCYHWYRQDLDGFWSHKDANDPVMKRDASGDRIVDPRTCDRGLYERFVSFFYVPKVGLRVETTQEYPQTPLLLPQPKFR